MKKQQKTSKLGAALSVVKAKLNSVKDSGAGVAKLLVAATAAMVVSLSLPQIHSNLLYRNSSSKIFRVSNVADTGHGTGFAVTTKSGAKVIMTNKHVCKFIPEGGLAVNETGTLFVKPVYIDSKADLCLMAYPPGRSIAGFTLASDSPVLNEDVLTMGYPLDQLKHIRRGAISGDRILEVAEPYDPTNPCAHPQWDSVKHRFQIMPDLTQDFNPFMPQICVESIFGTETSITIYPGNSGSPVLNVYGSLVGVVFAADNRPNLGVMMSYKDVKRVLEAN